MTVYEMLKPFGYIPGQYDVLCGKCGKIFALMDNSATRCKRCARLDMNEVAASMTPPPDANNG
jgi:endogenous inhibitor of DNA gyrase (YacG/DUF329 family)